jgi:hypothetical protein
VRRRGWALDCTIVGAFVEIDRTDGRTLSGPADYGKGGTRHLCKINMLVTIK